MALDLPPVAQAVPDPRCPECGNDVDENCENMDNCPRYSTGEYQNFELHDPST